MSISFDGIGDGIAFWGHTLPKLNFNKLNVKSIAKLRDKGLYSDGQGLYLKISATGSKSWVYFFKINGKRHELGLGSLQTTGLADARELARNAKKQLDDGINPIASKRVKKAQESKPTSFGEYALLKIDEWKPSWANAKHQNQWISSIKNYCAKIYDLDLNEIATNDILDVLKPIWNKTPETATRVRGRIHRILDAAAVEGLRTGENPARWDGHLKHLLAKPQKLKKGHHAALEYSKINEFYRSLCQLNSISAVAIEFTILTAARTSEVILAKFKEIDFESNIWIVPAERMKAKRDHRVPLTPRAIEILEIAKSQAEMLIPGESEKVIEAKILDSYIFRGARKPHLSNMAMLECLKGMKGYSKFTIHGFRSTFRDWVYETTDHPRELAEAALAHLFGDEAERAYRRGDALERRRQMMLDWQNYVILGQQK